MLRIQSLYTVLLTITSTCNSLSLLDIPAINDGQRLVPVTLQNTVVGGESINRTAQICATPPPDFDLRDRMQILQDARRAEKRGLSRRDSGLEQLGLESAYDIVEHGHPGWETGLTSPHIEGGSKSKRIVKRATPTPQLVIEAWFHIVVTQDQSNYYSLKVRNQMVNNQAIAMNQAYRSVGVTFHVNDHTYTIRDDWATDAQSTKMKQALRRGNYADLNIYFQSNLTSGGPGGSTLLGYCTFPTNITYTYNGQTYTYPRDQWVTDGCNVLAASLPGSPVTVYGYDQGKTAVHETGHWMGLLHTFQDNTCDSSNKGDFVDDTPQESTATSGCPSGKDSCPNRPGADPIQNYMDYSTDQCYTQFTDDQITRMRDLFTTLRQGH